VLICMAVPECTSDEQNTIAGAPYPSRISALSLFIGREMRREQKNR